MLPKFTTGAGSGIKVVLLFLALLGGCASHRSNYQAYKKHEGYRDLPQEDSVLVSNFVGNSSTSKNTAELFAKFRAIEVCHEKGKKLTHILNVKDRSLTKNVLRSSSTGYPSYYYYGMYPFYNRYSTLGVGISSGYSTVYEDTYVYPDFTVYYSCVDEAQGPEVVFREVGAQEMKLLVKDLRGAIQVEKIFDGSPNAGALEVGDVVLKARGQRIQTIVELMRSFSEDKKEVPLEILREGDRKKVVLKATDVSEFVLGSQEGIIKRSCAKKDVLPREICTKGK